ncbi:MAG TPA: GAF domain-containing protein [Aggregatilineales bacterium]|nr:GAF domain-containing protein [Anaerolineales bacterium]HRE48374.1 GAF domain-containing protein [Aggregatilineales bacterium]
MSAPSTTQTQTASAVTAWAAFLRRIFPLTHYTTPLGRRRATGTYLIAGILFLTLILAAAIAFLLHLQEGTLLSASGTIVRGLLLLGAATSGVILTSRGQQAWGALTLLLAWLVLLLPSMMLGQFSVTLGFAAMLVGISFAALLISESAVYFSAVYTFAAVFLTILSAGAPPTFTTLTQPFALLYVVVPILALHGGINAVIARSLATISIETKAQVEQHHVRLSAASGALAQQLLAARLDLGALLERTVKLVRESFADVSEAQLFLVDKDRRNATLVATTSTFGRAGLGQKVGVGSLNVVGRVTISGQSVLVRDSVDEQAYRRSGLLEGSRAGLVLPLRVGSDTIGALDLQSTSPTAFANEDVELLETLAAQIAVAIDNALLFADAHEKAAENQRLYEQANTSLQTIERLNQELMGGAWTEYLRGITTLPAFTIDPKSGRVEDAAERTPTMIEAGRRNQVIIRPGQSAKTITLPINVRGQVIGTMEFELAPDYNVSSEQMTLLKQVVERLGLAAENMRLLEEAQRIAQREATVNEITARMQAATNVEAVVATAAQSLADAFQAPRVAIRLGAPVKKT